MALGAFLRYMKGVGWLPKVLCKLRFFEYFQGSGPTSHTDIRLAVWELMESLGRRELWGIAQMKLAIRACRCGQPGPAGMMACINPRQDYRCIGPHPST